MSYHPTHFPTLLHHTIFATNPALPINHAPQMNRQNRRGRPGPSRPPNSHSHPHPRVPPARSIHPGTAVNIVQKADQPTGRTVSGAVSEVLTRGDHPRGVKVRLGDGRVGRVQSLRGEGSGSGDGNGGDPDGAGYTEENGMQVRTEGGASGSSGRRDRFTARDMRLDAPEEPAAEPMVLDMYVRPARGRQRGRKNKSGDGGEDGSAPVDANPRDAAVKCPVCAEFEGDEAAVAHHVAGHFGD